MENSEKEVSILIVEDDKYISNFICMSLKQEGYHYLKADTGREAIGLSYANNPDVVILDLGLPDMDGMEVIEHIRSNSDKPIIVVSARQEEGEKIKALDLGADDYVVKPYHPGEVVARVQAVLRRSRKAETQEDILRWQGLEVDVTAIVATVSRSGEPASILDLTPTEFSLLATLMRAPVRPFSRQYLLERCLPESEALERVVDTHIYNLRKKLEAAGVSGALVNVRGVGYRFRQP